MANLATILWSDDPTFSAVTLLVGSSDPIVPEMTYNVSSGTLNPTIPYPTNSVTALKVYS